MILLRLSFVLAVVNCGLIDYGPLFGIGADTTTAPVVTTTFMVSTTQPTTAPKTQTTAVTTASSSTAKITTTVSTTTQVSSTTTSTMPMTTATTPSLPWTINSTQSHTVLVLYTWHAQINPMTVDFNGKNNVLNLFEF